MHPECEKCEEPLKLILADPPWHDDYWLCPICDATYNRIEGDDE